MEQGKEMFLPYKQKTLFSSTNIKVSSKALKGLKFFLF